MSGAQTTITRSLKPREVVVRRICFAALAVTASSLAAAIAVAPAGAKTHHKNTPAPKPVKVTVTCTVNESVQVPAGSLAVTPPVDSGTQDGSAGCGSPVGSGVTTSTMTLQDTGDLTGKYWIYGPAGSLHGSYDLTQSANQPPSNPLSFFAAAYDGTLTVTGGTGALKGATGHGTSTCLTPDGVHMTCQEKLHLTLPPVK
jgi:hypothetical protein